MSKENGMTVVEDGDQGEEIDVSFALADYQTVHNDLLNIRSSRAQMFMGTLGLVGTFVVAILSASGSTASSANPYSWEPWLLWASLVPIGLRVVAIMETVNKTQGIAKRSSYLEVLSEYLRKKDFRIPHWSGWKKAVHAFERCTEYYSDTGGHKDCPLANNIRKEKDKEQTESSTELDTGKEAQTGDDTETKWKRFQQSCHLIWRGVLGEKKTAPACSAFAKVNTYSVTNMKSIPLLPNILYSTESLSMYVYIAVLFITSGGLLSILAAEIMGYPNFNLRHYLLPIFIGLTVGTILIGWNLRVRGRKGRRKLNTFNTVYAVFSSGLTLVLFISIHADFTGDNVKYWPAVAGYVLGATIAGVVVYSTFGFYRKLETLRRGKYSLERLRMQWSIMFKYCPLMDENTNVSIPFV